MSVGSTPTRATSARNGVRRPVVQWQRHLSYKEETGVRLPPGRFDHIHECECDGPRVCRRHPSLVRRGTEFDSRADLCSYRQTRAAGPTERRLACNQEIGVRLPGGPLWSTDRLDWKVAGYGWPGRTANAVSPRGMRVRIPCLPLRRPDGEEDDHASVLTRSPGFESWSGHRLDQSTALVVKWMIMPRF